jgi:hypothetical protein
VSLLGLATAREVRDLREALDALRVAHDRTTQWIAKELGLCVLERFHTGWGFSKVSPAEFALEHPPIVESKLRRCKKGAK